jgi:hypothetical protein
LLLRLFAGRIFHGSGASGEGEMGVGMGLVLSLLTLPGGFYSILLFDKYSSLLQWIRGGHETDPLAAALPDEYFLITLSMAVTGIVAVWRWDSIFPDRRDYSNLVPLPVSMRSIFLANLVAILVLAVVLAIDVNAASAVLFPLLVGSTQAKFSFFAQFIGVHALGVVTASILSFFGVFVIVGTLMIALPYNVFRSISLFLRSVIVASLVAMLSTSFAVPSLIRQLPTTWVKFLPPVWFVGLCQLLRGRATPPLAGLGWVALISSVAAVVGAVAINALSYQRCFLRIPETADVSPADNPDYTSWIFRALDHTVLSSPFQRATYRFVMKTLLRSERHGLVLAGFFSLGIVTASQYLFASFHGKMVDAGALPSAEVLAVPLVLSYCTLLGVRFVFDIPTEIQANWVFRLWLNKTTQECIPLARKIMLSFVLPWVFAVVLPLYVYIWDWRVGLLQTVVVTLWSLVLAEVLLLHFHKVPFTCSYPPFRDSAVVLALFWILGFFVFVVLTSNLEHWALLSPVLMASFVAIPLVAWYVLSRWREETAEIDKEIIFEENESGGFELLDLRHGS